MSNPLNFKFGGGKRLAEEVTAQRLNAILEELRRVRPLGGRGISVRQESHGVRIDALGRGGGGGSASPPTTHPFQIRSRQSPDNENQYFVTVGAGTINSILPTGIFSGGALAQTTLGSNALRYVTLTANSNGEQITTAAVSVESSAPEAQTPEIFGLPTTAKFLLGLVYNSSVFQVQFTNYVVTGKQQFITSKVGAGIGELPYEIHYVWG